MALLMLVMVIVVVCWANEDENRLLEDLFKSYNRLTRPIRHSHEAILVRFKFKLHQVLDVHEKEQMITTSGWLIQVG
jgi:hypothetical protein